MKKILKYVSLFSIAAFALSSCTENLTEDFTPELGKIKVTATSVLPGDTRVTVGELDGTTYPLAWSESEQIALAEVADGKSSFYESGNFVRTSNTTATFDFELTPADAASYKYVAVSPASAFRNGDGSYAFVTFLTEQTATETSVDPRAIVLTASTDSSVQGENMQFAFNALSAFGKMTVKDLKLVGDATVVSVKFTANKLTATNGRISGPNYMYYINGGDDDTDHFSSNGANVNYVNVNVEALNTDGSTAFPVWFGLAPTEEISGFTVAVTDSNGRTYSKDVDASAKPLAFNSGVVSGFTVNMSTAEVTEPEGPGKVWADGDYAVVAVYSGTSYALSNTTKSNGLSGTIVQYVAGAESLATTDGTIVWSVKYVDGAYTFQNKANNKYLAQNSDNKTDNGYAYTQDAPFELNIKENGDEACTISFVHPTSSAVYSVMLQTNSKFFAFYNSTASSRTGDNIYLVPVVYAEPEPSGVYYKLVDGPQAEEGKYLFIANKNGTDYLMSSVTSTGNTSYGYLNATAVTVSDNGVDAESVPANCVWTLEPAGDGSYYIKNADNGNYYYNTGTYKTYNITASVSSASAWTFASNSDGTQDVVSKSNSYYMQQGDGNYTTWGAYATKVANSPKLYFLAGEEGDQTDPTPGEGDADGTIVLDFSKATYGAYVNAYNKSTTATCDSYVWNLENCNNGQNNSNWDHIRIGSKTDGQPKNGTVSSAQAFSEAVKYVTVEAEHRNSTNTLTATLYVSTKPDFSDEVYTETQTITSRGDYTFNITTPTANCYYKVYFNCSAVSSNGDARVYKISLTY